MRGGGEGCAARWYRNTSPSPTHVNRPRNFPGTRGWVLGPAPACGAGAGMGNGVCSPWPGELRGSRAPPALSLKMEHLHSSTHAKIRRQTGASWQPARWVCCLSLCRNAKPGKCVWRSLWHVWGKQRPTCGHPAFGHSDGGAQEPASPLFSLSPFLQADGLYR